MKDYPLIEISPITTYGPGAKVKIDGMPIHWANGYEISHSAGEIPTMKISMNCRARYEHIGIVEIENLEEIASIISKEGLEKLNELWHQKHSEIS